jgi:hypothetical protein
VYVCSLSYSAAMRMRHIILSYMARIAVGYFSKLSHKRHDFREKVTEHKMRVLIFSRILAEKFLILRKIQLDIIINAQISSRKVLVILVRLWWNPEFSRQIFEKYSNTKFHENPSSGSRVLRGRTEGQTDMTKLIVAFRNFANAPKSWCSLSTPWLLPAEGPISTVFRLTSCLAVPQFSFLAEARS